MRKFWTVVRILILAAAIYFIWTVASWKLQTMTQPGQADEVHNLFQTPNHHSQSATNSARLAARFNPASSTAASSTAASSTAASSTAASSTNPTGSTISTKSTTSSTVRSTASSTAVKYTEPASTRRQTDPVSHDASASIPLILHQAFSSEMVYENYKPLINSCLSLNPNWTYFLWRDRDSEALISAKYPEFLPQYKKYTDGLERSDSIRYIVLHYFGGIYLDMDVECRKPFYPALSGTRSFLDQERVEQTNIHWGWPFSAMNSAMGAAPGHPFFRLMINELMRVSSVGNAFDTTGPAILTRVYTRYVKSNPAVPITLLEPKIMSPLMDKDKNWRMWCSGSMPSKTKPESQLTWKERGCRMLEGKNWSLDDTDASTVCIHRFLHLGYRFAAGARKRLLNATREFWPRVRFFSSMSP